MKTNILKRIRIERYLIAFLMVLVMVLIAQITSQKEIIFPEIAALVIGGWIAEKQPWIVNKRKIFLLMSLSALFGVLAVRYFPPVLPLQVMLCFIFSAAILTISRTTLVPVISACILPVYLGVDSWVYPISVTVMSLMIIIAQWQFEKRNMRPKNTYIPCKIDIKEEFKKWATLLIVLLIISFIPYESRYLFLLAPPLIVTYVEFSKPDTLIRKNWLKVWGILCFAAFLGAFVCYIFNLHWHMPLVIGASVATALMFFAFKKANMLFAPSGAIMLLPFILSQKDVLLYPLEVAVGSFVLIQAARILFKKRVKS